MITPETHLSSMPISHAHLSDAVTCMLGGVGGHRLPHPGPLAGDMDPPRPGHHSDDGISPPPVSEPDQEKSIPGREVDDELELDRLVMTFSTSLWHYYCVIIITG